MAPTAPKRPGVPLRVPLGAVALALLLALAALGAWGIGQGGDDHGIGADIDTYTPDPAADGTVGADGARRYETHAHLDVRPYSDAARAGLRDGDHLVRVGPVALSDSTVRDERERAEEAMQGRVGSTVEVVVRRGGEALRARVGRGVRRAELARSVGLSYRGLRALSDLLLLLSALSACAVGVTLFVRARGRGYLADLGLTLAGLGALVALAGGDDWVLSRSRWLVLAYVPLFLVGTPTLMRALARFPDGVATARWVRHLHWAPLVAAAAWMGVVVALSALSPVIGYERATALTRAATPFVGTTLMAVVLGGPALALASRYRRAEDVEVRQQMKWVIVPLAAMAAAFLARSVVQDFVPSMAASASLAAFLLDRATRVVLGLATVALPLSVLAGALRFRPWDADLWIGRSAAVGAATLGLAAMFAGGSEALRVGLRASMGEGADAVAAALAGIVSVIVFNPTREWVQARAERGLRRTREILGERLPLVLSGRQVVAPTSEIARVAIGGVRDALATDRAAVFVREPGGWHLAGVDGLDAPAALEWAEASALGADGALPAAACQVWDDPVFVLRVPLRSAEGEPVGLLALGTHGEGRGYSTEERRALDRFSRPLAEALLVAERRQADRDAEYARLVRLVEGGGAPTNAAPDGLPAG